MNDIVNQSIEKNNGFVKRYWKYRSMKCFKNEINHSNKTKKQRMKEVQGVSSPGFFYIMRGLEGKKPEKRIKMKKIIKKSIVWKSWHESCLYK